MRWLHHVLCHAHQQFWATRRLASARSFAPHGSPPPCVSSAAALSAPFASCPTRQARHRHRRHHRQKGRGVRVAAPAATAAIICLTGGSQMNSRLSRKSCITALQAFKRASPSRRHRPTRCPHQHARSAPQLARRPRFVSRSAKQCVRLAKPSRIATYASVHSVPSARKRPLSPSAAAHRQSSATRPIPRVGHGATRALRQAAALSKLPVARRCRLATYATPSLAHAPCAGAARATASATQSATRRSSCRSCAVQTGRRVRSAQQ